MKFLRHRASLILAAILILTGCTTQAGGLSERETGALTGSALGAGLGAIIGSQSGHAGAGTAIGAGAGLLAGAMAGESARRNKEQVKQELRQEMMQQQYQGQYAPQPVGYQAQPVQQTYQAPVQQQRQEIHTKYNPRTGQTFPERFQYDPNTGEELQYLR